MAFFSATQPRRGDTTAVGPKHLPHTHIYSGLHTNGYAHHTCTLHSCLTNWTQQKLRWGQSRCFAVNMIGLPVVLKVWSRDPPGVREAVSRGVPRQNKYTVCKLTTTCNGTRKLIDQLFSKQCYIFLRLHRIQHWGSTSVWGSLQLYIKAFEIQW